MRRGLRHDAQPGRPLSLALDYLRALLAPGTDEALTTAASWVGEQLDVGPMSAIWVRGLGSIDGWHGVTAVDQSDGAIGLDAALRHRTDRAARVLVHEAAHVVAARAGLALDDDHGPAFDAACCLVADALGIGRPDENLETWPYLIHSFRTV